MPIRLRTLREAATRSVPTLAKNLTEARDQGIRTAFLCHSHKDQEYVRGIEKLLVEEGWRVYIDWQDSTMPAVPNEQTASKIKRRISSANFFLFLATPNSTNSKWCPWEIGYADGVKSLDSIFIIPTTNDQGQHFGNEYLQLYRHIDISKGGPLGTWRPLEETGVLLKSI